MLLGSICRFTRLAAFAAVATVVCPSPLFSLAATEETTPFKAPEESTDSSHVIGFITLDQLISSLKDVSLRQSFLEALPTQWALPKFSASSTSELDQLQAWTKNIRTRILPALPLGESISNVTAEISSRTLTVPDVLNGLLHNAGTDKEGLFSTVFGGDTQTSLPPILKEFTTALPLHRGVQEEGGSASPSLSPVEDALRWLPSLDLLNTGRLSQIFAIPSELAWPISRQRLELLLPVLTRSTGEGQNSLAGLQFKDFDGLSALRVHLKDLLVPLSQADGSLLFANLTDVLPDFQLPATIDILPLATLENKELGSVDSLWSSVKGTMLSRMAVLGGETPFLVGPVLNLNSLPKLQLASSSLMQRLSEQGMPLKLNTTLDGTSDVIASVLETLDSGMPLDDRMKDLFSSRATRLHDAIVSPVEALLKTSDAKESTHLSDMLEQWRGAWERVSPQDFLSDHFFGMKLPLVAIPRDSLPGLFTSLKSLRGGCGEAAGESVTSCALNLPSLSALPLGAAFGEESLEAMYSRVEGLSEQLRTAVEQLQGRIMRNLPITEPASREKPATKSTEGAPKDVIALRQAMDATVKLADTMTAALQFTKKEVRALQLFNVPRDGGLAAGGLLDDLGASAAQLLKHSAPGSPSQLRSFVANIQGSPLLAVPRSVYNQLVKAAAGEHEQQQQTTTNNVRRRRLQAASQMPAATPAVSAPSTREDGLVLVDPLIFGNLLNNLRVVDAAGLRGKLKEVLPRAASGPSGGSEEARPLFPLPPLVEDLFANNSLSLPALTFPTSDLLRTGVFPTQLLNAPLSQWVSSAVIPTDFSGRTLPELLDVQAVAAQMQALPLGELLPGLRAAASSIGMELPSSLLEDGSGLLARTVGDLQINALLPPQLLHIPLSQLVDGSGVVGREILDLPLGSILAGGEAATSLLAQPFADVLGLRTVLESLATQPSTPLKIELPELGRATGGVSAAQAHLAQLLSAGGLPGGAVALPAVSGEWLSLPSLEKIVPGGAAGGIVGTVAGKIAPAAATAGGFLSGRAGANAAAPDAAAGVRGKRLPMGDALKNFSALTGLPLGNDLFF
ncbi:hypothetical protein BESB_081790 [Besnoitia besnoiti]|uniref:Transmembrane protein n=1 Tax=Besnoitia besnoiti TaxID=94643 RepID=A0A2A9MC60_BESBE|nr:hypothetical protein BESB_081790 [Besnoitia besnoiti]PFH32980.1 hypothetical protein BESB_081790 [Besnoitia besnoiti]